MRNLIDFPRCGALLGAALLLLSTTAAAQGTPTQGVPPLSQPPTENEVLGGHRFLLPQLQDSSFIVTSFATRIGVGLETIEGVPFAGLGPRTLRAGGLRQELDLSVRLNKRIAAFVQAQGTALLGLNGQTLLLTTGALQGDIKGGAAVRLWRNEGSGTQFTARFGGGVATGRALAVLPLLQTVANQPLDSLRSIVDGNLPDMLLMPVREDSGRVSVHMAQTLTSALSIQAALGGTALRRTSRPFDPASATRVESVSNELRGDAAVAMTVDGAPVHFPVALLAEYRFTTGAEREQTNDSSGHQLGGSIYYSGRDDLQLGVQGSYLLSGPQVVGLDEDRNEALSEPMKRTTGALVVRYTW